MRERVIAQVINRSTYRHRPPSAGPSPPLPCSRGGTGCGLDPPQYRVRATAVASRSRVFSISCFRDFFGKIIGCRKDSLLTNYFRNRTKTEFPDFTKTWFQGFRFSASRAFPLSGSRGFGCSRSSDSLASRRVASEWSVLTSEDFVGSCSRDSGLSRFRVFWRSWFHRFGRRRADDADADVDPPKLHNAAPHRLLPENGISSYRV
jgi:hypothetical protein